MPWLADTPVQLELIPPCCRAVNNICPSAAPVEQDPEVVVLADRPGPVCVLSDTLHVLAFATFVIVVVVATIRAKTLAAEMAIAINRVTLFIHVISFSHV